MHAHLDLCLPSHTSMIQIISFHVHAYARKGRSQKEYRPILLLRGRHIGPIRLSMPGENTGYSLLYTWELLPDAALLLTCVCQVTYDSRVLHIKFMVHVGVVKVTVNRI